MIGIQKIPLFCNFMHIFEVMSTVPLKNPLFAEIFKHKSPKSPEKCGKVFIPTPKSSKHYRLPFLNPLSSGFGKKMDRKGN